MEWEALKDVIQSLLSAAAIVLAAWATVRGNSRAKDKELTTMTPKDVRVRLDEVENRLGTMQNESWMDRDFMRRMIDKWMLHIPRVPLPEPLPPWLAAHYGQPPQHPPTPGSMIEDRRERPDNPQGGKP